MMKAQDGLVYCPRLHERHPEAMHLRVFRKLFPQRGGGGKSLLSISEVGLKEVFHTVDFFLDSIDAARFLYPPPAV